MLGICVVYLVPSPDAEVLLNLHLQHLEVSTQGPYRIYGVALRMSAPHIERLRQAGVLLPELAPHDPQDAYKDNSRGAGEHSHYLDQLVDHAVQDGCSHVVTLDMDSWPIFKGWDSHYAQYLSPGTPVIAMQRVETGDRYPNPAFIMFDRGFWRAGQSSFAFHNPRFKYAAAGLYQARPQTGLGILAELRLGRKMFLPLLRTNQWNPHPVMCGVYDQKVFHFGAGSRQPTFSTDVDDYDLIDTDISRAYVGHVNAAKREFLLNCLNTTGAEFIRQLVNGRLIQQIQTQSPAPGPAV